MDCYIIFVFINSSLWSSNDLIASREKQWNEHVKSIIKPLTSALKYWNIL
jgi:hypothetical protein